MMEIATHAAAKPREENFQINLSPKGLREMDDVAFLPHPNPD